MKYILSLFFVLFCGMSGHASSVNIFNDSPYTLNAQVIAADGSTLGRLIIAAGHMQTWQDYSGGTYAWSQTPYTVIFSCPTGKQYGVFPNVQQGATITALTSVGDRYCEPPKKQKKQMEEKVKQWEAHQKKKQNQSGSELETDAEWGPP